MPLRDVDADVDVGDESGVDVDDVDDNGSFDDVDDDDIFDDVVVVVDALLRVGILLENAAAAAVVVVAVPAAVEEGTDRLL